MRKLVLLLLIVPFVAFGQKKKDFKDDMYGGIEYEKREKKGSLKALERKRGFKNIILGSDVNLIIDDLELIESDTSFSSFPGLVFYKAINSDYLNIGDHIKLNELVVSAFRDKISHIIISFDNKFNQSIFSTFKRAYGTLYGQPNSYIDKYYWKTKNVTLALDIDRIRESQVLFIDNKMNKEIDAYKADLTTKALDDI